MASAHFTTRALSLLCLVLSCTASPHPRHEQRQAAPHVRQGCFTDNTNGQRALSADSTGSGTMTVEQCGSFCRRYKMFGLEYGRECWCGDALGSQSSQVGDAECSFPCAGNPAQKCGAGNRLDVYQNGAYSPRAPAVIGGAPYLGCFVDTGDPHPLPDRVVSRADMTGAQCAQNCAGYGYFGTEYGQECYCGNTAPAASKAPDSDCSLPCAGNDDELCGAGQRLTVYERIREPPVVSDFTYHGCHSDSDEQRVLTGPQSNAPDMTLEMCAGICQQYGWFGVEYGSQCFCGANLDPAAAERDESECNMPCSGNSRQLCGASYRLNVYTNAGRASTSSQIENKATVGAFGYRSCWNDPVASRALNDSASRDVDMTVEKCAGTCADFNYFGVEYASQCFCGNNLSGTSAPEGECSFLCGGDAKEWCGAAERMSLYQLGPE